MVAASRLNLQAELLLAGSCNKYCLSVDFVNFLLNTIDPTLAASAAEYMGLDKPTSELMVTPLLAAKTLWRLLGSAVVPRVANSRGIPQGLATSVTLVEIFKSCLLRRLAWLAQVEVIAYVDDINFLADHPAELNKALECLFQFAQDFRLSISGNKSYLWGLILLPHKPLGMHRGFELAASLNPWEWPLEAGVKPDHVKESLRIQEVKERLARMLHRPANIEVKAALSGPLNRLNVILSLLQPLDGRPLSRAHRWESSTASF